MSRLGILLLLAIIVSPGSFLARLPEPPRANEKWIELRADEFHFISNASPAKTLEVARDLLRMRAALGRVTHLKVRSALPTTVFIFNNERLFGAYRDAVMGRKTDHVIGVFAHSDTGNFILLRSDLEEIDRTVYHELTHYFVQNTGARLPLWISEGIAEYYSTFRTAGTDVHIGRPLTDHVYWLRGEKLIPLPELFATTSSSPIYNEGARSGVFYAQSWALFHYLMSDAGRREKFSRFLQLLGARKNVDEAFDAAFAMKYADLEQELRKYVRGRAFAYVRHSLGEIAIAEPPKATPMAHADVLFELGHLLTHSMPADIAVPERFLRESLTANAGNAAAHADLGLLYDMGGRRADADAAYRKAAQLGSTDVRVYLAMATGLANRSAGKRASQMSKAELHEARALFQRATELDPTSALAWAGLGATYMVEEDPAPGIAALEKSLQLAPANEEAAFHLLQFYARAGRADDAARLFETVLVNSSDADMVAHARQALLAAELYGVQGLAEKGKYKEAADLGKSVLARASDPLLKEHATEMLRQVESMAAVAAMNDAVAKANSGKYAEALEVLDATLPTITDPDLLAEARKFRTEVETRAKTQKKKSK